MILSLLGTCTVPAPSRAMTVVPTLGPVALGLTLCGGLMATSF